MTVTVDSALGTAWKYTKMYPYVVFGTGFDTYSEGFRKSWEAGKALKFKDRFTGAFKAGNTAAATAHQQLLSENGGSFWQATKKSITSIWPDLRDGWKAAGETAKTANKSKFLARLGSVGKVLGKRMPLIGAALTLAFELPNIIKATANEGVLTGAGETAKTGVRLGISTLLGAITQAIIPIPFLGGMVGFVAGDFLGRFIVGKSYTEKKATEQAAAGGSNNPFTIDTSTIPYGGGSFANDEEFQKLQQAYMQASGQNNNMNLTGGNITNPYGNFNTLM